MPQTPQSDPAELACPHCAKPLTAPLLAADSALQGFKCPHCGLFVPLDRAEQASSS